MPEEGLQGSLWNRFFSFPEKMSPASKSKPKDKKAGKEPQKTSSKSSGPGNASSGISASAYNPASGTFHTLEAVATSSTSPLHSNGRFRNIDETDDLGGSLNTGVEYDSVSNNGSWSGESEEHKEKTSNPAVRQEIIPGADNDKRDKIRQKNERKHQRQKERRAQELHDRCCGYLTSRKLEALAQQLVAMGFLHERATMALILNEGKLEESVTWLFEEGEDADKHRGQNLAGDNLKIDISDELAQIAELEIRHNCTKQEVERAVVASEGDIEKATESLKALKLEQPCSPPKPEETGDPPTTSNGKLSVAGSENVVRPQPKSNPPSVIQQKRDDKDFSFARSAVPVGGLIEPGSTNMQSLKRLQPRLEWAKPQQTAVSAEKRWPTAGSNLSASYSLASPLQASLLPAKPEAQYMAVGSDYKSLQPGIVREPINMMQRPQSVNTKHVPATSMSSPPASAAGWHLSSNSVDMMKPNYSMPNIPSTRSLGLNIPSSSQMLPQLYFQQQQQQHFVPSSSLGDSTVNSRGNGLWSRNGNSHTLAPASSLGLFSGLGSGSASGAPSPVDWGAAGSMTQFDYSSIDWSLDRGSAYQKPGGFWAGPGSLENRNQTFDSSIYGLGSKVSVRPAPSVNGVPMPGLQDGSDADTSAAGSREWTSPFEGKDLFSLPRRFVSSPSR